MQRLRAQHQHYELNDIGNNVVTHVTTLCKRFIRLSFHLWTEMRDPEIEGES